MSDQQQENEITTTQTAPAAPVTSDQAVLSAPAQVSAPEALKAAAPTTPVASEEAAPAKPKRTRRLAKPAADGEDAEKPKRRTTRTTRAKRPVATDASAPISDEVAQARALAQISEAQVVRARRRAAEREAAALTEFAAPVAPEAPAAEQSAEKPAPRTRRRAAAKRGFTITGGAIASTIGHDSHNVCVVGDNAADMMAAVEAVGQGGHVLVRNGEVVARIPLALGGLMSEGTAEDVAAQHDDFMVKARAMGIEPPLDPIMGIIFLPLPVIPTLRIRPEGMFDVTTFTYAD